MSRLTVAPPGFDPAAPTQVTTLPVGSPRTVRRYVKELVSRHRAAFGWLLTVNATAVAASMVGPWLLGGVVEGLASGKSLAALHMERTVLFFLLALLLQAGFTWLVRVRGAMLGEELLADLREDFLVRSVGLPPGVLERAGTGDLLSRVTTDIDRLSNAMREALPQMAIAVVWVLLLLGAMTATAPPLAVAVLAGVPLLVVGARWYFRRAPSAYRSEAAGYAAVASALAETVDAGRTVESLGLHERRTRLSDRRIREWVGWERYTLYLRSMLFPAVNLSHLFIVVTVLMAGGAFVLDGQMTVGQLTTGALYADMLAQPIGMALRWYDELQVAQVSIGRLVGVREIGAGPSDASLDPEGRDVVADDVRFGYRPDVDVLRDVTLSVAPGSRVALVGPSGAGKSTLGRLLAGIYEPRTGSVTLGGAALAKMPAERVRSHVALVNQEHHVFVGSLRDNLRLARSGAADEELWAALRAVDADGWAQGLSDGLETEVGSGKHALTPAQAQQIALARLVLADPHTLVLDEATSLLDPRAARHLERSLARVLDGRTVVAIAHRLHTAHDADVIAVVEQGRIAELGPHRDLVAAEGAYAALWHSWHGDDASDAGAGAAAPTGAAGSGGARDTAGVAGGDGAGAAVSE